MVNANGEIKVGRGVEQLENEWPFQNGTGRSKRFLKILTERAVTTEDERLFLGFTTISEKANSFFRKWLFPWRTLLWEGEESSSGPHLNTLNPTIRSTGRIKTKSLRSLFVVKVMNATYQHYS